MIPPRRVTAIYPQQYDFVALRDSLAESFSQFGPEHDLQHIANKLKRKGAFGSIVQEISSPVEATVWVIIPQTSTATLHVAVGHSLNKEYEDTLDKLRALKKAREYLEEYSKNEFVNNLIEEGKNGKLAGKNSYILTVPWSLSGIREQRQAELDMWKTLCVNQYSAFAKFLDTLTRNTIIKRNYIYDPWISSGNENTKTTNIMTSLDADEFEALLNHQNTERTVRALNTKTLELMVQPFGLYIGK